MNKCSLKLLTNECSDDILYVLKANTCLKERFDMKRFSQKTFLQKKVQLVLITSGFVLALFMAWYISGQNSSHAEAAICSEISYKTVRIASHDTLWSIAKANYKEEYGSLQNYIDDIKECNSLSSDSINAGCSIIVPVYVQNASISPGK